MFEFGLRCNHCGQIVKHNLILPKAIADFIVITDKSKGQFKDIHTPITTFHECKSSKNAKGFPIGNVKQHQIDYGLELTALGVDYWFHINDRRKIRHFKCYSIKVTDFVDVCNKIQLKYIPWGSLERVAISSKRLKGGMWDLGGVINNG